MIDLSRRSCLAGFAILCLPGAAGSALIVRPDGRASLTLTDDLPWWDESGCTDAWSIPRHPTAPALPGYPFSLDHSIF